MFSGGRWKVTRATYCNDVAMAGVAGVVLLWVLAPTALLIGLALWLLFPHAVSGAALLVLAVIAVLMLERRSQRMAIRRWY